MAAARFPFVFVAVSATSWFNSSKQGGLGGNNLNNKAEVVYENTGASLAINRQRNMLDVQSLVDGMCKVVLGVCVISAARKQLPVGLPRLHC